MRKSAKQRLDNRAARTHLRAAIRELRDTTDKDAAAKRYREVASLLDKAAGRHLLHPRNADRNKARLARYVNSLG
jgi:small subunit ribosomal protein S20